MQSYSWYITVNGNIIWQQKDPANFSKQSYNLAYWNRWKHQSIQPAFKCSTKQDTWSATIFGYFDFDFESILSAEDEAISMTNNPDINTHLGKIR